MQADYAFTSKWSRKVSFSPSVNIYGSASSHLCLEVSVPNPKVAGVHPILLQYLVDNLLLLAIVNATHFNSPL